MKHPDPKCQKTQEDFLKKCPESEKEFHERFFRIGNATYVYHQQAASINVKTQEAYYYEWLEGLPDAIRKDMQKRDMKLVRRCYHLQGMSTNDRISGWMIG